MSAATIFATFGLQHVVVGLLLYYVLTSIAAWHRLRQFDGPWLGKFSYLFMLRAQMSGRNWDIYTKLNKQYGPLVRIGPRELITDDPDIIRRMSAARSSYRRSTWYHAMKVNPHKETMFSMTDPVVHDKLKARAAAGYGGKENPTLKADIDSQIAEMVALLRRKYVSTAGELKPVDFALLAQYLALDTITKIAYGNAFGYIRTESDIQEYIKNVESITPLFHSCADVLPLQRIVFSKTALKLMGPSTKDKKGLGSLMRLVEILVFVSMIDYKALSNG